MQDFTKLDVWQRSHALTLGIYQVTTTFPSDEKFGITSQVRRASASIPANIAEGCGRGTQADLARFLQIAIGSASEVQYHLLLARDLGFLDSDNYTRLKTEVLSIRKMLVALIQRVRTPSQQPTCNTDN